MPVNIHGKEYVTVAERVKAGHADEDGVQSIITEMLHFADGIVVFRAVVTLASGRAFTGHAQQSSKDGGIAGKSPVEVCETSAVGRALGFAGFGDLDSIASADEMIAAAKRANSPKSAPTATNDKHNADIAAVTDLFRALHTSDATIGKTLAEYGNAADVPSLSPDNAAKLRARLEAALKKQQAAAVAAVAAVAGN